MDTESMLADMTDELLRRVGRNLINYQQIESMLKHLISHGKLVGPLPELNNLRQKNAKSISRTMFGLLVERFCEDLLELEDDDDPGFAPDEAKVPWFKLSVSFLSDERSNAELRDGLAGLVNDRNELVHHFASRWDRRSIESTERLLQELDEQRERLNPLHERLGEMVRGIRDGIRAQATFLTSPEGQHELDVIVLQQSPLARLLVECASRATREDRWLSVDSVKSVLERESPEQLKMLRERYGHKTLARFIVASNLFDLAEEPTARGSRTMYRLRKPT